MPFYGKPRPMAIDLVLEEDREMEKGYGFIQREGHTLFAEHYVPMCCGEGAPTFQAPHLRSSTPRGRS